MKQGVRLVVEGPEDVQLTAVVDRVAPEGQMELGCLNAAKAAVLRPNMAITLEYFREGVVYKMRSGITEVGPAPQQDDIKARRQIVVSAPRELKKIQRRRFPRATISINVTFMSVELPSDFDPTSRKGKKQLEKWAQEIPQSPHSAYTETVSASGLRFRALCKLAIGQKLFLQLELPGGPVNLVGEVVWLGTKPPQEVPGEAVGVDFKIISEPDRQAILEFVAGTTTAR